MLVFQACSAGTFNDCELWKSNGTAIGTVRVKDIVPGIASSSPTGIVALKKNFVFTACGPVRPNCELWKSDGTEAGTVQLKDIFDGPESSSPTPLFATDDSLFFSAFDPSSGRELWKTDGTEKDTVRVQDIAIGAGGSFPPPWYFRGAACFSRPTMARVRSSGHSQALLRISLDGRSKFTRRSSRKASEIRPTPTRKIYRSMNCNWSLTPIWKISPGNLL